MLINERTGRPVAIEVEVANTRATRNQGLLGREELRSRAIVLSPCFSVSRVHALSDRRVVRRPQWLRDQGCSGSQAVADSDGDAGESRREMAAELLAAVFESATACADHRIGQVDDRCSPTVARRHRLADHGHKHPTLTTTRTTRGPRRPRRFPGAPSADAIRSSTDAPRRETRPGRLVDPRDRKMGST
jgi:hypothetical protein